MNILPVNYLFLEYENNKITSMISKEYDKYISTISTRSMAASLLCCSYFIHLIKTLNPKRVIDFGSGFSSFAIRKYNKLTGSKIETWSVDSDKLWLERSIEFCNENGVDTNHFYTWDQVKDNDVPFDLIFFDIDRTVNRIRYFNDLFDRFSDNGSYILFDDMHKKVLSRHLHSKLKHIDHIFYDTSEVTRDRNRYSYLVKVGK